ncbi:MAG: type II secretion system F family protein [Chloroflexi bacterium]|nr:type II secretion system F family protein [Chloroflexota bacterium]
MDFGYVAYTSEKGVLKGVIKAASQEQARAELLQQGFRPLRLAPAHHLPTMETLFPSFFRVGTGEVVRFCRQMGTMLGSGASLVRTLEMLQGEARKGALRGTIADLQSTLEGGASFSDALSQHPKVFTPLFINVVKVGEYTGRLGPALDQMADILEREQEARKKMTATMMYPLGIMGLSMLTLFVLMTVAMPPLLTSFKQMGAELPLMTRIAISVSGGAQENFKTVFLGIVAAVIAFSLLRRIPRVRYGIDSAQLRVPIIGGFILSGELARFSRTMAMLLDAGVSVSSALQLGVSGCKNQRLRKAFADAEDSLLRGHGLAEALKGHSVLPGMFVQLVMIGEQSNSLRRTMTDAAAAYQKQLEQRLAGLLSIMEPASTVFVGGIVFFIALSMFLPIYSGMESLK